MVVSNEDILKAVKEISGKNGSIGRIEEKVDSLHKDVGNLQREVSEIKGRLPSFATKEDVEKAKHSATKSIVGMSVSIIAGASAWVAKLWPQGS